MSKARRNKKVLKILDAYSKKGRNFEMQLWSRFQQINRKQILGPASWLSYLGMHSCCCFLDELEQVFHWGLWCQSTLVSFLPELLMEARVMAEVTGFLPSTWETWNGPDLWPWSDPGMAIVDIWRVNISLNVSFCFLKDTGSWNMNLEDTGSWNMI